MWARGRDATVYHFLSLLGKNIDPNVLDLYTHTHTLPFIHRHRKESNLEPSVGEQKRLFRERVPSKLMQEFKIVHN